jgi:hypothetical protein
MVIFQFMTLHISYIIEVSFWANANFTMVSFIPEPRSLLYVSTIGLPLKVI